MPLSLAAPIGLVLHYGQGCRFLNCLGGGTKTFVFNEILSITFKNLVFSVLSHLIVQVVGIHPLSI